MSTVIIGSGASGLTTAIEIRRTNPDEQVTVIEKKTRESNTQVAGMRVREGVAGQRQDPYSEILQLFARRNDGVITPQMELFAATAVTELERWKNIIPFTDDPTWFGPQFGTSNRSGYGRGKSVLNQLEDIARQQGVNFIEGEVQQLHRDHYHVEGLTYHTSEGKSYRANADTIVLASGNIGGALYHSTNKKIRNSGPELAFNAGIPLTDSTIHMIHPFGNCDKDGNPRVGCFETDVLAGAQVYLFDRGTPILDEETTRLLAEHKAHYTFPEIVKRFRRYGSVVGLQFPNGKYDYARVSHHYGHLGIKTTDGISVEGVDNLKAVGDASNLGYWTNHKERFPGFGLLKCFTDARLTADMVAQSSGRDIELYYEGNVHPQEKGVDANQLRDINTRYLDQWLSTEEPSVRENVGQAWMHDLSGLPTEGSLADISLMTAYAHREIGSGREKEPLEICREGARTLRHEANHEVRMDYMARR